MHAIDQMTPLVEEPRRTWTAYLLDTLFAVAGVMLSTTLIASFQLYPRIPNISSIYLLAVLSLATWRGRYAATLAALLAFLSFNFFVIPPLYTFTVYRTEEWIALFVLLISGLLTSHLTATLRQQSQHIARKEYETRILYNLVRLINQEGRPELQLKVIARAIVDVFASWGIQDCEIIQPDAQGTLQVQVCASQDQPSPLLPGELTHAAWVIKHGQSLETIEHASTQHHQRAFKHSIYHTCYWLPLIIGAKTVGVLRLHIHKGGRQAEHFDFSQEARIDTHKYPHNAFFWAFLDQATLLIERSRLQRENLHLEVLQQTDTLRAALLSSVSHDLRTPLTVIKASASTLLEQDIHWEEAAQHSIARSIEREADRLNRLVGNLLDMSRIEEGALKPEKEWYQVRALIQDVLDRLSSLFEGRSVQLHGARDLPPVELDYLHLDQVLTNLLENAVRYTPPGTPIDIVVQPQEHEMLISVADRGPGIPQAEQKLIFDKFYRVLHHKQPGTSDISTPGSGLGLAVCKGLIEAHEGRIWVESHPQEGAQFFIALPLRPFEH